jgi:hypothetical protein
MMFVGLLLTAALFVLMFFVEVKGQNFAHVILPGLVAVICWGLSAACDTGIQVGAGAEAATYTYPFWGAVLQGAMWLFICLTLYNFGRETILKMRK